MKVVITKAYTDDKDGTKHRMGEVVDLPEEQAKRLILEGKAQERKAPPGPTETKQYPPGKEPDPAPEPDSDEDESESDDDEEGEKVKK